MSERKRNQLSDYPDVTTKSVSHHTQIHRHVPAPKRENPCEYTAPKPAALSGGGCDPPIWKTARCSPKATPPRRAGTSWRLYCPDGHGRTPNRAGAFAALLYRAALRKSRCADHTEVSKITSYGKTAINELVQSGTSVQVFPERRCQPHSEAYGGVLLGHTFAPSMQITVASASLQGFSFWRKIRESTRKDNRRRCGVMASVPMESYFIPDRVYLIYKRIDLYLLGYNIIDICLDFIPVRV